MSTLDNLPEETLLEILRHLSQNDKANIARVNKKIFHAALSSLYENPDLLHGRPDLWDVEDETDEERPEVLASAYFKLAATLSTAPGLCPMVKSLNIPTMIMQKFKTFSEHEATFLQPGFERLQSAFGPAPGPLVTAAWSNDLAVAILLARCSALRHLAIPARQLVDIDKDDDDYDVISIQHSTTFRLIKMATKANRPLSGTLLANLTSLTVTDLATPNVSDSDHPKILSVLFSLPALEKIVLRGLRAQHASDPWTCPQRSSSVRHIFLMDCAIEISTVREMVTSSKTLESFALLRECRQCSPNGSALSWPSLYEALRLHASSLESLWLHQGFKCWHSLEYADEPFTTLADLKSLRLLHAGGTPLFSNDHAPSLKHILPERLQVLYLELGRIKSPVTALHCLAALCSRHTQVKAIAFTAKSVPQKDVMALEDQYPDVLLQSFDKQREFILHSNSRLCVPSDRMPDLCKTLSMTLD